MDDTPLLDDFDRDDNIEDTDDIDYGEGAIALDPLLQGTIESDGAVAATVSLQQELVRSAVDSYYDQIGEPPMGRDYSKFIIDARGVLRMKDSLNVDIISKRTGKPLALSTIASRAGIRAVHEGLGFVDYKTPSKTRMSAKAVKLLQTARSKLPDADKIEMRDFPQRITEVRDNIAIAETALGEDPNVAQALATIDDPPLELRPLDSRMELRRESNALQTMRDKLVNNNAKVTELDEHIAMEKRKLMEAENEDERKRISKNIFDLQHERSGILEAIAGNVASLRSQISRLRETYTRMMNEDTTLGERIKTLFREQGITIVSILTAIGMTISTIVLAITGGSAVAPPAPTPPKPGGSVKDWIKKQLHALGRVLANLAGKAAAALPGIIGSIVSWILSTLGKTAVWLAGNLWVLVVAIGGLLLVAASKSLREAYEKKHK